MVFTGENSTSSVKQIILLHGNVSYLWSFFKTVVTQSYEADASKEHVIRGNAAIIRCSIPSFNADFVNVISWHSDQDESYFPGTDYGL